VDRSSLAASLEGTVLSRGEQGYDQARSLWNTRFDRHPELVAQCVNASDVAKAIDFARRSGVPLSVKGGGHSYAALTVAEGSLLVDLALMKTIRIDAAKRTAAVGGGVTCAELDAATQQHGLAAPLPTVSSIGVAGAALGGGSGYLSRKHGLALDNVLSFDVVTADGRAVRASEHENGDLFWALRGGGGNFGVVTSMELRLHAVGPDVLAGQIIYPFERAGGMLRFFRQFMADAPDDFQCYPFMFRVPPIDAFPAETHGQPVLDFVLYHRDPEAGDFVRPLRELGRPILDFVTRMPYVDVQRSFDPNLPAGQRYYSKAHDLPAMSDGAIDAAVEHVPQMRGAFSAAYFDASGGAISRVAASATAFAGREAAYGFHVLAGWMDAAEDESVMAWAGELHRAMTPHATGGVYVNLVADDELDRVPAAYGENYARLRELKRTWDPENVFSNNYNIPPAGQ
jgi:FAD/FMN-containing dehydrogenase